MPLGMHRNGPIGTSLQRLTGLLLLLLCAFCWSQPAAAANCYSATGQGTTGPANWQTYCWLDLTSYNNTAARSAAGQNLSYTLPDGTVMTFNLKVSGAAVNAAASPSWTGAAVGNTAFTGIAGRPILYQTAAGTTVATISNVVMTPPSGASAITSYMFVAADAESSNDGETLRFQTNGGAWTVLDQSGPISGATYPTVTGINTNNVLTTGVPGTVGAYIFGSTTPTTITTTMVGGGLQGAMFAVRFASIRLNQQIVGTRINTADQFKFDIRATASSAVLATGTTTGTGLGPFTAAALSSSSALPLTLFQSMAGSSVSAQSQYRTTLTCTNASVSSTALPSNVTTTNYNFGTLQFGDNVSCTFTSTPFPHLQLRKVMGTGGRRFASDQFIMSIEQGGSVVATTTTAGTGSTVINGFTPEIQATVGAVYTFEEAGAGATSLDQYTQTMACTNGWTGSSTALPTAVGGAVAPQMGDVILCTITNRRRAANATLAVSKTSTLLSDPVTGTTAPFHIPGAIVRYRLDVLNSGSLSVDNNTVFLVDTLPADIRVGTAASPAFTQGTPSSGLTFTAGTDIRYSNAVTAPASFAACTYTPVSAYDPAVRHICLNPKGTMAASTGTPPNFSITFNAEVR